MLAEDREGAHIGLSSEDSPLAADKHSGPQSGHIQIAAVTAGLASVFFKFLVLRAGKLIRRGRNNIPQETRVEVPPRKFVGVGKLIAAGAPYFDESSPRRPGPALGTFRNRS